MNVLYLLFSFTTGGTERLVTDICNEMVLRDNKVYLYVVNDNYEESMLQELDERVVVLLQKRDISSGGLFSTMIKIARYVRINKIELVHCNSLNAPELLILSRLFNPKVKIVQTIHGLGQCKDLPKARITFRNMVCNKIIAISNAVREDLGKSGIDLRKIVVVHNAIDVKRFLNISEKKCNQDNVVIGCVARIEPKVKGQDILINALNILNKKGCRFVCYFAGAYAERHVDDYCKLTQMVTEYNLNEKVVFLGNVNNVQDFLRTIDIFVQPSRSEGFGISMIEAMCMGVPCIGSDIGGIAEIVKKEKIGTLFYSGDENNLAEKLLQVIKNIDNEKSISRDSVKKIADEYCMERMCDSLLSVYEEVRNR